MRTQQGDFMKNIMNKNNKYDLNVGEVELFEFVNGLSLWLK